MIFVDANVFLRHLVQPSTPQDRAYARAAAALFQQVLDGTVETTTSEAILAEVVFILSAKQHYNTPRETVVNGLRPLLHPNHFRLPRKQVCLRALDIWLTVPKLSFPDALAAAYSEQLGNALATFDRDLAGMADITSHVFP